jgi:hypothetical protein
MSMAERLPSEGSLYTDLYPSRRRPPYIRKRRRDSPDQNNSRAGFHASAG